MNAAQTTGRYKGSAAGSGSGELVPRQRYKVRERSGLRVLALLYNLKLEKVVKKEILRQGKNKRGLETRKTREREREKDRLTLKVPIGCIKKANVCIIHVSQNNMHVLYL